MRRLIEGLDELAGHDVVIARGDAPRREHRTELRQAWLRRPAWWASKTVGTPDRSGLAAPEHKHLPLRSCGAVPGLE